MNQAEDRLSELEDKIEDLDQISKEYEKNLKVHREGTYKKIGHNNKLLNYRHR